MFEIKRYTPQEEKTWDQFVTCSKNGTFLFLRQYMDYHSSRFRDHSLLFYDERGLYAVMPANEEGTTLHSHQGLTYGGLVVNERATVSGICRLFEEMNDYLSQQHFSKVLYKAVPWIYHRQPSEEDLYAIANICQGNLVTRHISTTISLSDPIHWRRDHRYGANKAFSDGITVEQSNDFTGFWNVLNDNLLQKYGAQPVHSLDEITLLHDRFPQHIRLYTAKKDGILLGGTVVYCCEKVAHAQYISATPEGKRLHAIDALFKHVLADESLGALFFDFGKSSNGDGHDLNTSLVSQKEGFGGRGICYDWYEWTL